MRGSAPLLGAVTSLAVPPTSRVPHLAAHILSRQSPNIAKISPSVCIKHARTFKNSPDQLFRASKAIKSTTTVTLPIQLAEPIEDTQVTKEKEEQVSSGDISNVFGEKHGASAEYVAGAKIITKEAGRKTHSVLQRVEALVQDGQVERLRLALTDRKLIREYVRYASDAEFTRTLQLLDAEVLLDDYKHIYRHVKPSLTTQPVFRSIRTLEDRFEKFKSDLDRIFKLRRDAGHKLSLDVCKIMLKAAKTIGMGPLASEVFDSIMPEDGIEPDLECYNLLMEAWCWNHAYTTSEWQDLRVTRFRLQVRSANNPMPPLRFSGYKVDRSADGELSTETGLRVRTLTTFRALVAKGLKGDEVTFTNVMIAMAREGDLDGVKSILKSVWNIDADMLAAYDEEEIQSPTFYELDHPLRPSSRLLFTIVHTFAINNQVASAFILLDYVSRNYNLLIPSHVWLELCLWTRVMASHRTQAQKAKGEAEGQVDWRVFERLWQVMTDEPHNLQPDGPLLAHRTANLGRARLLDETVDSIRDMRTQLETSKSSVQSSFWKILKHIEDIPAHHNESDLSAEFWVLRRAFVTASQIYERDLQETIVATRRLVTKRTWAEGRTDYEWTTRRLPALLLEFQDQTPNRVEYDTPTGHVELSGKSMRMGALKSTSWMNIQHSTWFGVLRLILDVDDLHEVRSRIQTMKIGGQVRAALDTGHAKQVEKVVQELFS